MKKITLVLLAAGTIYGAFAQKKTDTDPRPPAAANAAHPPVPPPPGPGHHPGTPPPPPDHKEAVSAFSGTVIGTVANDDFVYDGFQLRSGNDTLLVHFPPHLGSQVMALAKPGASVTGSGRVHHTPNGAQKIRMTTLTVGGTTVSDTARPAGKPAPPAETAVEGKGRIKTVQQNKDGKPIGYILDDNTLLRLPPGAASDAAQAGSEVSYSGFQHQPAGEAVMANNYRIVHCKSLTAGGRTVQF